MAYCWVKQEVSELIGGQISVQDEEDVEDELAALESEVAKKQDVQQQQQQNLPSVPDTQLPSHKVGEEARPEPATERKAQKERQPMLA